MATRIRVTAPSALLEASRALQAANRRRLEGRNREGHVIGRIQTAARREEVNPAATIWRSRPDLDPWRGAVPEYEDPGIQRSKRLGYEVGSVSVETTQADDKVDYKITSADGSSTYTISQATGMRLYNENSVQTIVTPGAKVPLKIPEIWVGTTTYNKRVKSDNIIWDVYSQALVLPVGKDVAIICVFFQHYKTTVQADGLTQEVIVTDYDPSGENPQIFTKSITWTGAASSSVGSSSGRSQQAVIVSKSSVRQIPVPGTLLEKWQQFQPLGTFKQFPGGTRGELSISGTFANIPAVAIRDPTPINTITYGQSTGGFIVVENGSVNRPTINSPTTGSYSTYQYLISGLELQLSQNTYDPSAMPISRAGSTSLDVITPGIYSALSGGVSSVLTGAQAADRLEGVGIPAYSLLPTTSGPTRFDLTPGFYIGQEKPTFSRVANPRGRVDGGNVFFWDWGNPGYCRARLLELGFSEADLIP
jgi:hypothetical protein